MLRIRMLKQFILVASGGIALAAATSPTHAAALRFHTRLIRSEPAANDTLHASPRAVRLWFTEKVELRVTTVRLANDAGVPVTLAPLARPDTGERAPIVAALPGALVPGGYVVSWSTAARDGHPAKGTFAFVVRAAR